MKKIVATCSLLISLLVLNVFATSIGDKVDEYNGVAVHYNGPEWLKSYGINYAADGYCYGQKWQCVEFVIRYYDVALHHRFPSIYGHARDFWNLAVDQGQLEKSRGLVQYYNDDKEAPKVNDILVFPFSKYGHVCIVSKVSNDKVEVVQQNMEGKTRDTYNLTFNNGNYTVSNGNQKPVGWLRK